MSSKYIVVSGVIFALLAVAQFLRALNEVPVQLGGVDIPVWVSWVAVVVAGSMSAWAFASRK